VRARALGRRPWGHNSTLFAVILNMFSSRNLDQSMLKNAKFWEKNCKNRLSMGDSAPECPFASGDSAPRPLRCYSHCYNFVELVSSAKCILFRSKKNQVTQWRSKGGKWRHAFWGAGLGGVTAHFLQSF